ncbi:Fip1 motif-domain-containing protein [Fimicolochytrium jonesii]|uniref:Fip1 motif-domain-containing protein n=1 Tax=Fimicolochytrium jonesii TaxID=1396493 RepID=UPI0022FE176C|nr:Fip1 motif-domain-containing protein [Fimicolochytrium jonesii]KAI8819578.1 Fip1 motif-domain-containing protein [Fimicolochytrium jonesii]
MDDDDLDQFLYGEAVSKSESNGQAPTPPTQEEVSAGELVEEVEETAPAAVADGEEDDAPYEPPEDDDDEPYEPPQAQETPAQSGAVSQNLSSLDVDGEDEEDDDSDDDIEIVLDSIGPGAQSAPTTPGNNMHSHQHPQVQQLQRTNTSESATVKASPVVRIPAKLAQPIPRQDGTIAPPVKPPVITKSVVDVEEAGKFDGVELINLDLDTLEEKPWRRPGADITDFFNYGFNEQTWKAYCGKQKGMREKVAAQVAEVGMSAGALGIGMPGQQQQIAGARPGKRPREEDEMMDYATAEDMMMAQHQQQPLQMRNPRFFPPDGFMPDFGGPPPMGMFGGPVSALLRASFV